MQKKQPKANEFRPVQKSRSNLEDYLIDPIAKRSGSII